MKTMKLKKLLLTSILSLGLSVSAFAGGHKYSIDASNVSDYADMLSARNMSVIVISGLTAFVFVMAINNSYIFKFDVCLINPNIFSIFTIFNIIFLIYYW